MIVADYSRLHETEAQPYNNICATANTFVVKYKSSVTKVEMNCVHSNEQSVTTSNHTHTHTHKHTNKNYPSFPGFSQGL